MKSTAPFMRSFSPEIANVSDKIIDMRKIIVLSFVSLDGIMQGPGGPTEDTSGGFTLGGWTVPYFDEALGQTMSEQMGRPFDLLLGRKTFLSSQRWQPGAAIVRPEFGRVFVSPAQHE